MYYILIFCLMTSPAYAREEIKFYDPSGKYEGKINERGMIYDRSGRFTGKIHEDGRITDDKGHFVGRVKKGSEDELERL